MEVSGRIGTSDSTISCQPCQDDGDTVQAEGFCENCNQFICSSCIKAHRKLLVTKKHVIKRKDEMPTSVAAQSYPCTELCDVHKNEIVKFYCKEHDNVGCGDCMVLEHTSCKVQLVSDVSCNYDNSDELALIKHRIKHLKNNLDSCKTEIKMSLKTADEVKTSIIKEIKQFHKEMDIYLDTVTKELIQEVETLSDSDVARQQELQSQCKATTEDIEQMQSKLEQCKDNVRDLFVSSKRIQNKLKMCQDLNEQISSKSKINSFQFTPNDDLDALKVKKMRLGNLNTQMKTFSGLFKKSIYERKTHFVEKFNIKGKQESNCYISGLSIISDTEILCADCENKSLKVFNHKEGKITSTLKTSSPPGGVTTIDSSSAATVLPHEGKILLLNTLIGLTTSHSLKVRERCLAIDHHKGIMAVTFFSPATVQLIDMDGHILHEVKDTSMLNEPFYVCLSNDNESTFVSDWNNAAVFEFSQQGRLINTIKSKEMAKPAGVTVNNCGSIVVCYPNIRDNVGVIVPGAREILPLSVQYLKKPQSVIICEVQNRMFISEHKVSTDANFIKLYDLK